MPKAWASCTAAVPELENGNACCRHLRQQRCCLDHMAFRPHAHSHTPCSLARVAKTSFMQQGGVETIGQCCR
eukprot:CAMPEP_0171243022 /NCGR_PEP_ID=MMETSP0790-20130122/46046_1 /TAXON_ID=2925 /ORGANISM="Alexandrium catenella, Strain OF101" /LENGTH=71 /DNA_ID=CAMNT_0011709949 /DNA_START=41 /DNA_END=254 /DNA_ORIENTATION=+